MMTFNEKLVVLRKIKHLTQDEFASAVGVSRQAVYKWESGQSYPEVQKLIEMKLLFGISIDDLLDDTFEIELPKKKRKKRTPKANVEATEETVVIESPKSPIENYKAPEAAPVVKEEPKAEPAPAPKAAPVVKEEPKVEPKVEAPVVEEVVEEVVETPVEKTPRVEFTATKIDINDPTDKFAKKGGLFSKIFGNKK